MNNPDPHPQILDYLEWITTPDAAWIVSHGNGNLQPVSQMADPELFARYTTEELEALQWDEFDERIANAVEFDIVPQYDALYDLYTRAMPRALVSGRGGENGRTMSDRTGPGLHGRRRSSRLRGPRFALRGVTRAFGREPRG